MVPFLIAIGIGFVVCFVLWEQRLTRRGTDTLLKLSMLDIPQLRSGLSSMLVMMFTMGGVFFVLPLYLQIVLGKDPLQTGVHILPLSLAVLFTSLIASRLSSRVAPRRIVRIGIVLIVLGTLLLLVSMDLTFHRAELNIAMAIVGVGMGCMASQLANVNLSSVGEHDSSEVGGLQGTAQNLGTALGTAIIGSILLTALLNAFDHKIANNPQIAPQTRTEVSQHTEKGIEFVPVGPAKEQLLKAGVPASQANQLASDYADAQVDALKIALGGVAVIVLLSFPVTRKLPGEPLNAPGPGAAAPSRRRDVWRGCPGFAPRRRAKSGALGAVAQDVAAAAPRCRRDRRESGLARADRLRPQALAAPRRSISSLAELELGAGDQVRDLLGNAGAGERREHGRLGVEPGEGDGRRRGLVSGGDLVERREHPRAALGLEVGAGALGALRLLRALRPVLAGEEAAREREVGKDREALALAELELAVGLEVALHQVVVRLQGDVLGQALVAARLERRCEAVGGDVGGADRAHLAGLDELAERTEGLLLRGVGIVAVRVVEVDPVRAEAFERLLGAAL